MKVKNNFIRMGLVLCLAVLSLSFCSKYAHGSTQILSDERASVLYGGCYTCTSESTCNSKNTCDGAYEEDCTYQNAHVGDRKHCTTDGSAVNCSHDKAVCYKRINCSWDSLSDICYSRSTLNVSAMTSCRYW